MKKKQEYKDRMARLEMKKQWAFQLRVMFIKERKPVAECMQIIKANADAARFQNHEQAGQITLAWREFEKAVKQIGATR